jgi:integrase/recombinase XerD
LSFLRFFREKSIEEITNGDVIIYNNEFILKNKLSASYQNQVVNAIKLFFFKIENTKIDVDLVHRPKRYNPLPNVLSKEEVKSILNALGNIKHRTMLSLIYSCGLRRSELLNLKPLDIDSKRNLVIIRSAKGNKDRIVPLSEKILLMLHEYYKIYKPQTWLFEGQVKNRPYDERSLVSVLKRALIKANIKKAVSLHWLRHKHSKTTEIYTHVSMIGTQKLKSPLDDLDT